MCVCGITLGHTVSLKDCVPNLTSSDSECVTPVEAVHGQPTQSNPHFHQKSRSDTLMASTVFCLRQTKLLLGGWLDKYVSLESIKSPSLNQNLLFLQTRAIGQSHYQGTNLPSTWHRPIGSHSPQSPKSQRRDSKYDPKEEHF